MAKGIKTGGKNFTKDHQPKAKGRKPLPSDLKEANKLTKERLRGLINKYLWISNGDLKKIAKDPKAMGIDSLIASIIHRAITTGDHYRLNFILDRMIGKVKEEIDITSYVKKLDELTKEEMIALGREAINYLDKNDEE